MKKFFFLASLLCLVFSVRSQTFYRDYPDSVQSYSPVYTFKSGSGGLIANSYIAPGGTFLYDRLTRFNDHGDTLWSKRNIFTDTIYRVFYDTSLPTYPYYDTVSFVGKTASICRLHNGNYIIAAKDDQAPGGEDIMLKQIDTAGNIISSLPIYNSPYVAGSMFAANLQLVEIPNTDSFYLLYSNNDVILSPFGLTDSTVNTVAIMKIDNHFNVLWSKTFREKYAHLAPRPDMPLVDFNTITVTTEGGLAFCRYNDTSFATITTAATTTYMPRYLLDKWRPDGTVQWEHPLQAIFGTPANTSIFARGMFNTSDSGIVADIYTITGSGAETTTYIMKLNAPGIVTDTVRADSPVYVPGRGVELSNGRYLFFGSSMYGFCVSDSHLNFLYVVPWPFAENGYYPVHLIANNMGGAFIAFEGDISSLPHDVAINFDSSFQCFPSFVSGYVNKDNNYDCAYGGGDERRGGAVRLHEAATGVDYYGFSSGVTGQYTANVPYGNYSVTHSTYGYVANECGSYSLNITSPVTLPGNDFYDTLIPGVRDFHISLYGNAMRPGEPSDLFAYLHNNGTTNMDSTVSVTLDSRVSYLSSVPAPASISGNTLTYNMHLGPDSSAEIAINVLPSTSLVYTDVLLFSATSPYVNTIDPGSDTTAVSVAVSAAFDPNVKMVNQEFYFDKNNDIVYTICFQNTGNDTARTVVILDTMDRLIDPGTFKLLSSTHGMPEVMYWSGNRFLFSFKNIYLPDSVHNEPASHGCFSYMVKVKPTAVSGDTIRNTANIFFDYNAAVVTNTTTNVIGTAFPAGVVNNIKDDVIRLYPNPTSGIVTLSVSDGGTYSLQIMDVTGRVLLTTERIGPMSKIDLSDNAPGVYLIKLTNKLTREVVVKKVMLSN